MDERRVAELFHEIGAAIVRDQEVSRKRWDCLALVVEMMGTASSMHGYLYRGAEWVPFAPEGDALCFDLFPALHEEMARDEASGPWKACLCTITKPRYDIELDFEYENARRWAVTPRNIETIPAQLRPSKLRSLALTMVPASDEAARKPTKKKPAKKTPAKKTPAKKPARR